MNVILIFLHSEDNKSYCYENMNVNYLRITQM